MALLQTIDLKRYFGETRAVDNVNLSIEEREFVSLVGPNGAGKTSLINVISALLAPQSGKIIFKGEDITALSVTQRVRAGIARSFQLVNVFDDLTAFDNVALAIFSRDGKTARLGTLAHLDGDVTKEADGILEQFGLLQYFDHVQGTDGFPCKPAPDVLFTALKALDARPEDCLFIGDSPADMEAGRRAGVKTCAVTYGYGRPEALAQFTPDYWVDDLRAIRR